jgi:hypothetical protein
VTRRNDDKPYLSFPAGRLLSGALWLCIGADLAAQPVYRVTDEDGNVTFTDTPRGNGQVQVEAQTLNPTNTAKAVSTAEPISKAGEPSEPIRYDTRIVMPAENATIPMGPGNFTVEASLSPAMKGDESRRAPANTDLATHQCLSRSTSAAGGAPDGRRSAARRIGTANGVRHAAHSEAIA